MVTKNITEIFHEIADLLELQGVQYKPRAKRTAARNIESMKGKTLKVYYEKERLTDIEEGEFPRREVPSVYHNGIP